LSGDQCLKHHAIGGHDDATRPINWSLQVVNPTNVESLVGAFGALGTGA